MLLSNSIEVHMAKWKSIGSIIAAFIVLTVCADFSNAENSTAEDSNAEASAAQNEVKKPEQIEQYQPAFYVRASLDRSSRVYSKGDFVSLKVVSEKDAYLYIMYRQADDSVYQIFPNSIHKDNYVKAKETVTLGARGDAFRWMVSAPFGKEAITVIASVEPIEELSKKEQIARQFNPVSSKQLKGVATVLARNVWSNASVELETRPDKSLTKSISRRIGLFIGVAEHLYADEEAESYRRLKEQNPQLPKFAGSNVPGPDNGAKMLAKLMQRESKLDDLRVLINEQATRGAIEEAFTRWLPEQTNPGDTVFIYYSGKTSQIDDDNGDEKDRRDEIMTAHDSLSRLALSSFIDRLKGEQPSSTKQRHAKELLEKLAGARLRRVNLVRNVTRVQRGQQIIDLAMEKSNKELRQKVFDFLVRESAISDDVLGRWLQYLDGRHVVVVLDTCHAGGYASLEKSFTARGSGTLDLLDGEASRLKDIGQRDLAILASSSVTQKSRLIEFRPETKIPVMGRFSAFVCFGLMEVATPATVSDLYAHIKSAMDRFNKKLPANERHDSKFFDDLTEPVYIKR